MSGPPSSAAPSNPAFRSAPDEKARPAPVISSARTESSSDARSTISLSSSPNSEFQALRLSGRLRVTRPMPPSCSQSMVS
jgi:hypothetical protein